MENNKKKIMLSILITLLLIVVVSSGTYAVYKWRSTHSLNVSVSVTDNIIITFNGGPNITGRLIPVANAYDGIVKKMTIKANFPNDDYFNLYLKTTTLPSELKTTSFRWKLATCDYRNRDSAYLEHCFNDLKRGIGFEIDGNFSTTNMSDYIDNVSGDMLILEEWSIPYISELELYLYLWIDGTVDNNVNMGSKSIDFDLYATGNTEGTLAGNS